MEFFKYTKSGLENLKKSLSSIIAQKYLVIIMYKGESIVKLIKISLIPDKVMIIKNL